MDDVNCDSGVTVMGRLRLVCTCTRFLPAHTLRLHLLTITVLQSLLRTWAHNFASNTCQMFIFLRFSTVYGLKRSSPCTWSCPRYFLVQE
jgi:hypothetical protein